MPELPEVETIKRGLSTKVVGLTIKNIQILNQKSFPQDPKLVTGATITSVWRRAKVLGIDLSNNYTLLFHLKMSGQIIYKSSKTRVVGGHPTKDMMLDMPNKSTRAIIEFDNSSKLFFNDQRKFGWIKVISTDKLNEDPFLKKLGPEPLDQNFTPDVLHQALIKHPKIAVKVAILDQTSLAGVGNIYACEACFLAKLHPKTPVGKLTKQDFTKLSNGIVTSLESSIKYGGSSKHTYVNDVGEKGYFLEVANVYDRRGLPCRICQTPISKITLAGRGTYFCPQCQSDKITK